MRYMPLVRLLRKELCLAVGLLIRVQKALAKLSLEGDEAVGASIVHHAVEAPLAAARF